MMISIAIIMFPNHAAINWLSIGLLPKTLQMLFTI
jgi:hypothetical protein